MKDFILRHNIVLKLLKITHNVVNMEIKFDIFNESLSNLKNITANIKPIF